MYTGKHLPNFSFEDEGILVPGLIEPTCMSDQNYKQDRQFTCNVTLRHVRVTIVAVEDQKVIHILGVCW